MQYESCLLSDDNGFLIEGIPIGQMIAAAGRRHLWEERSGPAAVDVIVIHYTSAVALTPETPFRKDLILKLFCDYGVSSHYLIVRGGAIDLLVPEEKKAWHAGGSIMPGPDNRRAVNDFSIGIELVATATSGFTPAQYSALSQLCADIERRHARKFVCVGHDQVAGNRAVSLGLRKDKKTDPGELFEWNRFFNLLEQERLAQRT